MLFLHILALAVVADLYRLAVKAWAAKGFLGMCTGKALADATPDNMETLDKAEACLELRAAEVRTVYYGWKKFCEGIGLDAETLFAAFRLEIESPLRDLLNADTKHFSQEADEIASMFGERWAGVA